MSEQCLVCESSNRMARSDHRGMRTGIMNVYAIGRLLFVTVEEEDEAFGARIRNTVRFPVKFCPMCGRELAK